MTDIIFIIKLETIDETLKISKMSCVKICQDHYAHKIFSVVQSKYCKLCCDLQLAKSKYVLTFR